MPTKKSLNKDGSLCSGYRVLPGGAKCKGCIDCDFGKSKKSVNQAFGETHSTVIVGGKKANVVSDPQPTMKVVHRQIPAKKKKGGKK